MDHNEVSTLLHIAEKSHVQGNLPNIRNAALSRLREIEAELAPKPAAPVAVEPEPATEPEEAA